MNTIVIEQRGAIAVLRLDNPPVNALSAPLREALSEALNRAAADERVHAIVLVGSERAFSAGGDIREFGRADATRFPMVHDLTAQLDTIRKPLLAAMSGYALGGGLELALGCHYRVADANARMGTPEVKLGVVPSAGGTQRLPRIVRVADALDLLLSGSEIDAGKAREIGLVDEIAVGDVLDAAVAFAERIIAEGRGIRRARDQTPQGHDVKGFFATRRADILKTSRGAETPGVILDCVEAAVTLPFEEGQRLAERGWRARIDSVEARALRHLFLAEREAAKIPGLAPDLALRPIRQAAVIGAGTMGGGIAMNFANAGIPVTVIDAKPEALERGLALIRRNYATTVSKGGLAQAEMDRRMALIKGSLSIADAGPADVLIEAVFERMPLKLDIFRELDRVARPGAILASNTSTLNIDRMADVTRRPQDVIGMHFFAPANVMKLLEVIRGARTADDVLATVMALGKTIGKVAIVSGVCEGFIGNRMLAANRLQIQFMIDEGATPWQVDAALRRFGMAQGPFQVQDQSGLDISWDLRKAKAAAGVPHVAWPAADRLCEAGRFGQKAGKGWYRYEPGSRVPIPDPEVELILDECRRASGLPRREISDEEIVERAQLALANEGARILEEGIALRASDLDVAYANGYGFPRHRGGPMFHADTLGLAYVLERIEHYARGYRGERWKPAPLLARLAAEGRRFAEA